MISASADNWGYVWYIRYVSVITVSLTFIKLMAFCLWACKKGIRKLGPRVSMTTVCAEKAYPNDVGYDIYFESIFRISHWDRVAHTAGRRCSGWGWIWRHSDDKAEWIWGWIAPSVHITHFAFFQLTAIKAFGWSPFAVTSESLKPTISWRIFDIKSAKNKVFQFHRKSVRSKFSYLRLMLWSGAFVVYVKLTELMTADVPMGNARPVLLTTKICNLKVSKSTKTAFPVSRPSETRKPTACTLLDSYNFERIFLFKTVFQNFYQVHSSLFYLFLSHTLWFRYQVMRQNYTVQTTVQMQWQNGKFS